MSATEALGSRRGPLGYARDLAPARCRFRSTRFLPFSGTLLQPHYRQPPGVSPRLVDPPASPRVLRLSAPRNGAHKCGVRRKGSPERGDEGGTGGGPAFQRGSSLANHAGMSKDWERTAWHVRWTQPGSRGGSRAGMPRRRSRSLRPFTGTLPGSWRPGAVPPSGGPRPVCRGIPRGRPRCRRYRAGISASARRPGSH